MPLKWDRNVMVAYWMDGGVKCRGRGVSCPVALKYIHKLAFLHSLFIGGGTILQCLIYVIYKDCYGGLGLYKENTYGRDPMKDREIDTSYQSLLIQFVWSHWPNTWSWTYNANGANTYESKVIFLGFKSFPEKKYIFVYSRYIKIYHNAIRYDQNTCAMKHHCVTPKVWQRRQEARGGYGQHVWVTVCTLNNMDGAHVQGKTKQTVTP